MSVANRRKSIITKQGSAVSDKDTKQRQAEALEQAKLERALGLDPMEEESSEDDAVSMHPRKHVHNEGSNSSDMFQSDDALEAPQAKGQKQSRLAKALGRK